MGEYRDGALEGVSRGVFEMLPSRLCFLRRAYHFDRSDIDVYERVIMIGLEHLIVAIIVAPI